MALFKYTGTKFIISDTQPPHNSGHLSPPCHSSCRFSSKRVSPKVPTGTYSIADVTYELNVLGMRGPRCMHCTVHSIPASSLEPSGIVPDQPTLGPCLLEDSFRSISLSKSIDSSSEFGSSRFFDIFSASHEEGVECKEISLVPKNKPPRWHEELQCWCLNFRGRATVASVKNFQPISDTPPQQSGSAPPQQSGSGKSDHDKIIL